MNKGRRFELSDEELERIGAVRSAKVSNAAAAVQLLRAPRSLPDVVRVVGQSVRDRIISNSSLISLLQVVEPGAGGIGNTGQGRRVIVGQA